MMYFGQSNFLSLPLIVWAKWKRSRFLFLSFYWTFSRFFFLSFYLNELSQCFSLHDCNYWGNRIIMILKINFFISMKVKFLSQWSLDLSYLIAMFDWSQRSFSRYLCQSSTKVVQLILICQTEPIYHHELKQSSISLFKETHALKTLAFIGETSIKWWTNKIMN